MKVQLFPVDQPQLMIKLFIKYSYIFCKQDKKLQIIYNKHGMFCSYLASNYKTSNDHFYVIKFDLVDKIAYIWDQFAFNIKKLCDHNQKEINKCFKECQKTYPRFFV